jgi:uncharacterized protein YkwD
MLRDLKPTLARSSFIRLQCAGLFLGLIFCAAPRHVVRGQSVDGPPVARLITTSSYSRPRRMQPVGKDLAASATGVVSPSLDEANQIERRAFERTNLERAKKGLPSLVWDPELCRLARNHSKNMARSGYFSHLTSDGQRLRDRVREIGITHYTALGENIAYNLGYEDPGAFAVERWMLSPAHRANILESGFKAMAVGSFVAADGSVFLTLTFITR